MNPLRVEDILAFRMLADPRLSPDGSLVAFTVIDQDPDENVQKAAVWVAATDGSTPARRLTRGPRRDGRPRFSPDGTRLAFLSNREKDWRQDLYVIELAGGEPRLVASLPRGILDFDWSPDSSRFALLGRPDWPQDPDRKPAKDADEARKRYAERVRHITRFRYRMDGIGQLDDEQPQVWVAAAEGGVEPRQLTDGPWGAARPRWTADGRVAFLANRDPDHESSEALDVWAVSPGGGEAERLTTTGNPIHAFAFSPTGRLALIRCQQGPGSLFARHARLYIDGDCRSCDIDRSAWAGVLSDTIPGVEVPDPVWSEDGASVYTPMTDRGTIGVRRLEVAGGPLQPVIGGRRVVPAFAVAGGRVAFLATAPDDPLSLRVATADGADETVIFDPNPWVRDRDLATLREFNIEHEGRTVDGWALLPPGHSGGRLPTVLAIHGGPHAAYGWSFQFVQNILAGSGLALVYCNSPGSQTYEEDYSASLTGRWGELDFPVWMALVDRAIADGFADPDRLGVSGASYGGFSTLWVIGHTDRFRAAVSMRPVADLHAFYGSSDIGWSFGATSFGAEPWQDRELFSRLSPVTYAERMVTPLRLIGSSGDLRTPLEQAEQVYVRLKKLGREVDLVIFHGEPHAVVTQGKPWNRVRHMRAVLEWWEQYLGARPGQGAEATELNAARA